MKKEAIRVELKQGESYYWCRCGLSGKQPFCDGRHKNADTDLRSLKFVAEKTESVFLCQCKQSKNPPFCDGSHKEVG